MRRRNKSRFFVSDSANVCHLFWFRFCSIRCNVAPDFRFATPRIGSVLNDMVWTWMLGPTRISFTPPAVFFIRQLHMLISNVPDVAYLWVLYIRCSHTSTCASSGMWNFETQNFPMKPHLSVFDVWDCHKHLQNFVGIFKCAIVLSVLGAWNCHNRVENFVGVFKFAIVLSLLGAWDCHKHLENCWCLQICNRPVCVGCMGSPQISLKFTPVSDVTRRPLHFILVHSSNEAHQHSALRWWSTNS